MPTRPSPLRLAFLVLALLAGPLFAQEVETLVETWPDGSKRIERQVVRDEGGRPIDDGDWRSWHENGQLAAEGSMKEGKRVGMWRTWHANGQLASKGSYRRGLRIQKWTYLDESGARDGGESGEYSAEFNTYADGTPESEGEYRYKHRHGVWRFFYPDGSLREEGAYHLGRRSGTWTLYWPEGGVMRSGEYERDERTGAWTFTHPNGLRDPRFLSGTYAEDVRVGPLETTEAPEEVAEDLADRLDPGPWPAPTPFTPATDSDRLVLAAAFEAFVRGGEAQGEALETLSGWRQANVPLVLERLMRLDPTRTEDALLGYRLHYVLLHEALGGHVFPWRSGTSPEDVLHNRWTTLRWHTLWRLEGANERFWETLAAVDPTTDPERLFHLPGTVEPGPGTRPFGSAAGPGLPLAGGADAGSEVAPLAAAPSINHTKLLKLHGGRGTEDALARALAWLVTVQASDGGWDADGWPNAFGPGEQALCDGLGHATFDTGVTALALLALVQAGHSPGGDGPYAEPIRRAMAWLLARQDVETGVFGPQDSHEFVYGHAIATLALVEADRLAPDPATRARIELALEAIFAAQNQGLGWRYEMPAVPGARGANDTSVTAWMVAALAAAERNDYRVPQSAFDGALNWVERVTHDTTGRVGYDAQGGMSSRNFQSNADFPLDGDEAMTAAGLYIRLLCGQDPEKVQAIELHADVLLAALPTWNDAEPRNFMYYWHYGTQAMFQLGGPRWRTWNTAMKETLVDNQRTDGPCAGSWDPVGPWGYAGGRIYSTSLMALCLSSYFRPRYAE